MSFWRQHAQLLRLGERADGSINVCEFYHAPICEIRLDNGDPIDCDDQATNAFFRLINFDAEQGLSSLSAFNQCFRVWLTGRSCNPWESASEVNDFFETRHVGDGWTKLDRLFDYMSFTTLSATVDSTDVIFSPGDDITDAADFFTVGLAVSDKGLLSNVAIIRFRAVASTFDLVLPLVQEVIDDQASRWSRLSQLGRYSIEYMEEDKHQRAKPSYVYIEKKWKLLHGRLLSSA